MSPPRGPVGGDPDPTGGDRAPAWWIRLSAAVYRIFLLRYPARLRRRFGPEMVEAFQEMLREGRERGGVPGVVGAWLRALRDLARPTPGPVEERQGTEDREGRMGGERRWVRGVVTDGGSAVRSLVREPRFSLTVVGVLGMALALNAGVFSVVNAYLLQPLPFPGSERIVQVRNAPGVSWTEVDAVFDRAVSWDLDVFTLVGEGGARSVRGSWITPGFLEMYGLAPAVGRSFRPEETVEGAAPVAMISHALWQERFGGDPGVVGQSFEAFTADRPDHAESFRIVGVLPRDAWYVNEFTGVLAPLREERQLYAGRLRPDVAPEQAVALLTELAGSRMQTVPEGYRAELVRLQDAYVDGVRPTLTVLQVAVLLVLLIAGANALVLLVVRGTRREREFGVRRALGAGGDRLVRQLVLEGLLLTSAAGVLGLAGAALGLDGLAGAVQARLGTAAPGGIQALGLDATVVGLTLATSLGLGLLFGLLSFGVARGAGGSGLLRGRGGGDTRGRARLRNAMVVGELAFSMALLAGAALMVRSALNLQRLELGFDPARMVVGEVGLRLASYPEPEERVEAFETLLAGIRELPGVESAAWVGRAPFGSFVNTFLLESGDAGGVPVGRGDVTVNTVGDGYFSTMGVELVAGRDFGEVDVRGGEAVVVVSASTAQRLWPGGGAVGGRLRTLPQEVGSGQEPGEWYRVVGIVTDAEYDLRVEDVGQVYFPLRQAGPLWMELVARARPGVAPLSLEAPIRDALATLDPEIPFSDVATAESLVGAALAPPRFTAGVLVAFAGCAGLLAILGLYGVVAYAARQRRRDVAIRMAVGADAGDVTGLFVRQGALLVLLGVTLGTLGGLALGRALSAELHQVSPHDPLLHGGTALALLLTALLAVWIPARRASRADPMRVLREE